MSVVITIDDDDEDDELDCAVCWEQCVYPTELPCKHIFCYMCVKGVAKSSPKCPLCRKSFPLKYLLQPKLVKPDEIEKTDKHHFQWFYEGRSGGWWQYDFRSCAVLEESFQGKKKSCKLLLAGKMYDIDLVAMTQHCSGGQPRRIKRDKRVSNKLGVAGLRVKRPRTRSMKQAYPVVKLQRLH